jgi:hypothetical protein
MSGPVTLNSPTIATPTMTGQAVIPSINLTGGQIVFPAAQNPSSNANTLDDYEEGFWTPTLVDTTGGSASVYLNRYGQYIKIGKLVQLRFIIQLGNRGTLAGGELQVTGLPFEFDGGGLVQQSGYLYQGWSGSFVKGSTTFYGSGDRFTEFVNNGTNMSGSNTTNSFYLWGGASYLAST